MSYISEKLECKQFWPVQLAPTTQIEWFMIACAVCIDITIMQLSICLIEDSEIYSFKKFLIICRNDNLQQNFSNLSPCLLLPCRETCHHSFLWYNRNFKQSTTGGKQENTQSNLYWHIVVKKDKHFLFQFLQNKKRNVVIGHLQLREFINDS